MTEIMTADEKRKKREAAAIAVVQRMRRRNTPKQNQPRRYRPQQKKSSRLAWYELPPRQHVSVRRKIDKEALHPDGFLVATGGPHEGMITGYWEVLDQPSLAGEEVVVYYEYHKEELPRDYFTACVECGALGPPAHRRSYGNSVYDRDFNLHDRRELHGTTWEKWSWLTEPRCNRCFFRKALRQLREQVEAQRQDSDYYDLIYVARVYKSIINRPMAERESYATEIYEKMSLSEYRRKNLTTFRCGSNGQ